MLKAIFELEEQAEAYIEQGNEVEADRLWEKSEKMSKDYEEGIEIPDPPLVHQGGSHDR